MVDPHSYDRLLETALREVDDKITAMVDRAFAGLADDPDAPLPWIGVFPQRRSVQKQMVTAALRARVWFKFEAPLWAQPLLLKAEDCQALFKRPHGDDYRANRGAALRGDYGLHAREVWWDLKNMRPFEVFSSS
jgi:hypothetical protein